MPSLQAPRAQRGNPVRQLSIFAAPDRARDDEPCLIYQVPAIDALPSGAGQLKITEQYYYLPSGRLLHRRDDSTEWGVDPSEGMYVSHEDDEYRELFRVRREEDIIRREGDGEEAQANWKMLLDRVIAGELDGAHMLAGQPIAATIGFGTKAHIITAYSMDLNGNGITVSNEIWEDMKARNPGLQADKPPHPITAHMLKPIVDEYKFLGQPLRQAGEIARGHRDDDVAGLRLGDEGSEQLVDARHDLRGDTARRELRGKTREVEALLL